MNLTDFQIANYPTPIQELIKAAPSTELGPGTENHDARSELTSLSIDSIGNKVTDPKMAQCCVSGLWLLHHFLDDSHSISQDIETSEGSFWHGIMHRREPDYSNAKYWFNRVGDHPVFASIVARIEQRPELQPVVKQFNLVEAGNWNPDRFIDACQAVSRNDDTDSQTGLLAIAEIEWQSLFDFCFENANI